MNRTYRTEKGSALENSAKIKLLRAVQRPLLAGFWQLEQRISRIQDELKARPRTSRSANLNLTLEKRT